MAAFQSGSAATPLRRRPPNLVIVLADDLGYGDVGCYGNTTIATPYIDSLAREGLRFTDFHSNGAICSPTRAALLTGCYPQRFGIERVFTPSRHYTSPGLPLEAVTFAERLRDGGYATGLFGKWHLGYPAAFGPCRQGFDSFTGYVSGNVDYHSHIDNAGNADWWRDSEITPEAGYTTSLITRHAVDFIRESKDRPFCLYVAHEAPHDPYQGPGDAAFRELGKAAPGEGPREDKAGAYREMVQALDAGVGALVAAIHTCGLERDTLMFFCSDNGAKPPGANAPLAGRKGTLWEGGHRVPAIAWWPGRIATGVCDDTAMTMDLLPTLLAAADVEEPDHAVDGINLLPRMLGGAAPEERTLFWRTGANPREWAARRGPWKLHKRGDSMALYHLVDDLAETHDRAAENPDVLTSLMEELAVWEAQFKDIAPRN